MVIKDYFIF